MAFSADGTHILSGRVDETLRQWDAKSGHPASRCADTRAGSGAWR
ncbi:MAG: hypothetical protein ABW318_19725 [Vicinamibacterales bacterium]